MGKEKSTDSGTPVTSTSSEDLSHLNPVQLGPSEDTGRVANLVYGDTYSGSSLSRPRLEDESQYDESYVETRFTTDADRLAHRIEAQGGWDEAGNAILGGLAKVPFTIIGTTANILDLENYYQTGTDYHNSITDEMNKINASIEGATPIYGASSENGIIGNREWWMNLAKSTVEYGVSFAATGFGVGSVLRGGAGLLGAATAEGINAARASFNLTEKIATANRALFAATGEELGSLGTSALLTHAEGVQMAAQVFDNAVPIHLENYFKLNPKEDREDPEAQARAKDYAVSKAAENADKAHHINMINTAFNFTSVNRIFTPISQSRELAKRASMREIAGGWSSEMAQELVEENINNFSENLAMNDAKLEGKKDTFGVIWESIKEQGLEASLGGAFGGLFQTGLIDVKKGVTGEYARQNERYRELEANQAFLTELQQNKGILNSVPGQLTLEDLVKKAAFATNKIDEINNLAIQGKTSEVELAKKELLQYHAFNAFKVGNGKQMEQILDLASGNLTPEERVHASEAKKAFKDAEEVYNNSVYAVEPKKQEDVYFNTLQRKNLENQSKELTVEKIKLKSQLLSEIERLKFVGMGKSYTGRQRVIKDRLAAIVNDPAASFTEEALALEEIETYSQEKGTINYPSQDNYIESVKKLAINEQALTRNILEFNAIKDGSFYEQKEVNAAAQAVEAKRVADELAYKESQKREQLKKENTLAIKDISTKYGLQVKEHSDGSVEIISKPSERTPEDEAIATEEARKELLARGLKIRPSVAPVAPKPKEVIINGRKISLVTKNPNTEIVTSEIDLKKDNQILLSPAGKFGIRTPTEEDPNAISWFDSVEEAENSLYIPKPSEKDLLKEAIKERWQGALDSIGTAEELGITPEKGKEGWFYGTVEAGLPAEQTLNAPTKVMIEYKINNFYYNLLNTLEGFDKDQVSIPEPKTLTIAEATLFKEQVLNGNNTSIDGGDPISDIDPSDGFINKKIVNGFNAVATTSTVGEFDEKGQFHRTGNNLQNMNQNILSTNGEIDAGTELFIRPTYKDIKGSGKPNYKLSDPVNGHNAEFEIITKDGSPVGFVHEIGWCTENTIANEREELQNLEEGKGNIVRNRILLEEIRRALVREFTDGKKESIPIQVTSKSSGTAEYSVKSDTIENRTTSDPRVVLAVVKDGDIFVNENSIHGFLGERDGSVLDFKPGEEFYSKYQGMTVMIVPSPVRSGAAGNVYKVSFLETPQPLSNNILTSVKQVLNAYLTQDEKTLKAFGVANNRDSVQAYVNKFFYTSFEKKDSEGSPNKYYFVVDEFVRKDNTSRREVHAHTAQGVQTTLMFAEMEGDLSATLDSVLIGRNFNLDLRSNENNTNINIITNNAGIQPVTYTTIAKQNSYTAIEPMILNNVGGEIAYFHNPVLQFDPTNILVQTKPDKVEDIELIVAEEVIATRELITKPTVDWDSVDNESASSVFESPLDEQEIYKSSGLITFTTTDKVSGETVLKYMDLEKVDDITNLIYNAIIDGYIKNNKLTPKQGIKNFISYAKGQIKFYTQFTDQKYALGEKEIALGASPTYVGNQLMVDNWNDVLNNLDQLLPEVVIKLNATGFKIKGNLNVAEILSSAEEVTVEEAKEDVESKDPEDIGETADTPEKAKFGESSFEVDPITKLSPKLKAFFRSIKTDRKSYLGTTTIADPEALHNKVMSILSNKFLDYNQIVEELKKHIKTPVIKRVVEKLESASPALKNSFTTHFYKEHINLITAKQGKTFNPNRESLEKIVLNSFGTGVQNKAGTILDDGSNIITLSEESKKLWELVQKDPSVPNVKGYLDSIGIVVTLDTLNHMKDYTGTDYFTKEYNIRGSWKFQFGINGVFHRINKHLTDNQGKKIETISDSSVLDSTIKKEGAFEDLARIEALYRDSDVSNVLVNGEGKTIFGFTLPNMVAIRMARLKANADGLVTKLKNINFTKRAVWLDKVKDPNFGIFYFDVNDLYGNKDSARPFHELSDKNKAQTRVTLFTNVFGQTRATKEVTTRFISSAKSDKTKALGIQYTKFTIGFDAGRIDEATVDQVAQAAFAEYDRILANQETPKSKKIVGYNPTMFYLFPSLNSIEGLFIGDKVNADKASAYALIRQEVRKAVEDEIAYTAEQFTKWGFINKGQIKEGIIHSDYNKYITGQIVPEISRARYFVSDYVVNQMVANYNYMAMFSGDPALAYKTKKGDKTKQDFAETTLDNYFKRLTKDVAPGQVSANSNTSSINQIFINDPKGEYRISKNIDQLKAVLGEDADVYDDIEIADGSEYTSLSEHLDNLYNEGELEAADYTRLMNQIAAANKLEQDVKLSKTDLVKVLKPSKPRYVYNKADSVNDVDHVIYIKAASFPLFAQITRTTKLDPLRVAMEKSGVDRAAFKSATKMGMTNPLDFDKILPDTDLKPNIELLPREGLGVQQTVPYDETKTEILQGSQPQKLLFEGLGKAFAGLKQQFDAHQVALMANSFNELKEEFGIKEYATGELVVEDMTKFAELLKEELLSRKYNPNDLDSLQLSPIDPNNPKASREFQIPLWFNSNAARMESLILSLFTNRILKQKLAGQAYALVSELGTEEGLTTQEANDIIKTDSYDPKTGLLPQRIVDKDGNIVTDAEKLAELRNMTDTQLKETGYTIKGSQVFLPWDFRDNDGNILDIKKFITKGKIDFNKLPKNLLEQIGYRIPTQGHNSMAFIEVVGFLPDYMAKSVVASKDFTKQMGSDYDIDKLYIHRNYTFHDAELGTLSRDNLIEHKNDIVDIYKQVLSDPRVFHKIIKPLDFGELENVNKELKKIEKFNKPKRSVLSPFQQDENFNTGTAGKTGVSQTSILSTFSALLQGNNVSIIEEVKVLLNGRVTPISALSNPLSLTGRPKIEVISAFQSASVDNIKELLLNLVNYNTITNPALNTLALLGLDEYFISYLFTQNSVLDLVDYNKDLTKEQRASATLLITEEIKTIREELTNLVNQNEKRKKEEKPEIEITETLLKDKVEEKLKRTISIPVELLKGITVDFLSDSDVGAILNTPIVYDKDLLYKNLENPGINIIEYYKNQLSTASLFDQVTDIGNELIITQSVINMYTSGYTNNTQDLATKLSNINTTAKFEGMDNLIGEIGAPDTYNKAIVLPTTPIGLGYEIGRKAHSLMNQFFPYSSPLVNAVQGAIGAATSKEKKRINDFIKTTLIASSNLFKEENIDTLRKRLLLGENSLAHRWLEFKKTNPNNVLARRIECKISNNDTYPSVIKYLMTSGTKTDDFNVVKTLIEMLNDPANTELAEDTIKYLMATGGIQLPNNFVKLIPNDYLIKKGFGKDLFPKVEDETRTKLLTNVIVKQYYQHFPVKATLFDESKVNEEKSLTEGINAPSTRRFIRVNYSVPDGQGGIKESTYLYESLETKNKNGNTIYQRIPILGKGIIKEANWTEKDKPSVFTDNNPETVVVIPTPVPKGPVHIQPNVPEGNKDLLDLGLNNTGSGRIYVLKVLASISAKSKTKAHKALAQVLMKVVDILPENITINIKENPTNNNGKKVNGLWSTENNELSLRASLPREDLERILLHELIHAVTVNSIAIFKFPAIFKTKDTPDLSPKTIEVLTSLTRLYDTAKKQFIEKNKDNPDLVVDGQIKEYTGRTYGFSKLEEFITEALTREEFQQELAGLAFGDKSIIDRFKELIKKLVTSFTTPSEFHKISGKDTEYLDAVLTETLDLFNELNESLSPTIKKTEGITSVYDPNANVVSYNYYGKNYDVVTDSNGLGVDVMNFNRNASETNAKFQERKAKLLDHYNINYTKDVVAGKKQIPTPTPIKKEAKYELFPGVFANVGQKEAIDKIEAFLKPSDPKKEFVLQGKGGTGKTTIIKKVLGEIDPGKSIIGIAPTHKAKKVLNKSIGKHVSEVITLASSLAIKLNENTGRFEPDEYRRKRGEIPIKFADVIILDESSMISDALLEEIRKFKKPSAKIIFMGDRAQLPPVGQDTDSKVFDIPSGYTLTEKMRQAKDSPIIGVGTVVAANVEVENYVDRKREPITPEMRVNSTDPVSGSSIVWESDENKALDSYVKDFKEAPGDVNNAKIITFNNQVHDNPQSVKSLNEKVRKKLFDTKEQFVKGELLTAYSDYTIGQRTLFNNSDDLIVNSFEEAPNTEVAVKDEYGGRFTANYDMIILTVKSEYGETFNVPVIANSSKEKYKKDLKSLFDNSKTRQLGYRLSSSLPDLEYGYAITSHKAQGSTYKNVYVMEDNILGPSNGGSLKAKNQSLYVAVSRPTDKLVMVSTKNPKQGEVKVVTTKPSGKFVVKEYTPENVTSLKPNEVFVFGSNAKGVHGRGAALDAKQKFGAIQGQAEGLQGQSYAIITKKDYNVKRSSTLPEIGKGIQDMLLFAKNNPNKKFLVPLIGTENAGYSVAEIKSLFEKLKNFIPNNVVLPKEFEIRTEVAPQVTPTIVTPKPTPQPGGLEGMFPTSEELKELGLTDGDIQDFASLLDVSENSYNRVLKSFLGSLKSGQLSLTRLNNAIKKIDNFDKSPNKEGLILKQLCK